MRNEANSVIFPKAKTGEPGESDDDMNSNDEDDDSDEDVDFDDDEEPAAKKGGKPLGGKGANKEAPKGKDGKECKQQ